MIDYIMPIIVGIAIGLAIGYVIAKMLEKTKAAKILRNTRKEAATILKEAQILANENYKITEAKYLNQLAVQAEMTDAQNQKIQAEFLTGFLVVGAHRKLTI